MAVKENKSCYASAVQRDILLTLSENKTIQNYFFLTGETALSVFYLHHRKSDDLDLFTIDDLNMNEIDFWVQRKFSNVSKINDNDFIKSYLIDGVKVDLVIDHLSIKDEKVTVILEKNVDTRLDSIRNIASNKLCTIVSRSEIKDYIDIYFLNEKGYIENLKGLYSDAMNKDRIFEDAPTAAYKIEEGFEFVKNNYDILPSIIGNFDKIRFESFFKTLIKSIYNRLN